MPVASFQFLTFSLAVIIAYNLVSSVVWRQGVLIAASVVFLGTFAAGIASYIPLAAFLAVGYIGVRAMQSGMRAAFWPFLIATILAFVWLKKYSFLPANVFVRSPYVMIGVSYIFFRILHLIIDSQGADLSRKLSAPRYLAYTLNFTTLVSGPIQRYEDFAAMQFAPVRMPLSIIDGGIALERIIIGFFKVNVLSLLLSVAQRRAISALSGDLSFGDRTSTGVAVAVLYTMYLYFNFSGYMDIVIGVARFLRLELPENFDRPFSADNFINFWGRWHITLSTWLKTYVYNPLLIALMRKYPSPTLEPFFGVGAYFFTFFLLGIWHGQTSVFVVFGILQGLGVSVNKLYQITMAEMLGRKKYKALSTSVLYTAFARGLTFTWFTFSLFWFWSNWSQMASMARAMGGAAIGAMWIVIFLVSAVVLALYEAVREWILSFQWNGSSFVLSRYVRTVWDTALTVISVVVVAILNAPAPEIVYKAF